MSNDDAPIRITAEEALSAPLHALRDSGGPPESRRTKSRAWIAVASIVVVGFIGAMWAIRSGSGTDALAIKGESITPELRDDMSTRGTMTLPHGLSASGLQRSDLALASPQLFGGWTAHRRQVQLADTTWSGSCCVVEQTEDNRLRLVTNSHCLGLTGIDGNISESDEYQLLVRFPSGSVRQVLRIADQVSEIDLALLEVDGTGLTEGTDYVVLPPLTEFSSLAPGEEVVAVGSPYGLFGTQTFGRISALRSELPNGVNCRTIQVDAAINPGNSGGPLFIRAESGYRWIGVNTLRFVDPTTGDVVPGIGFAIHISEVGNAGYFWQPANATGARQLVEQLYRRRGR